MAISQMKAADILPCKHLKIIYDNLNGKNYNKHIPEHFYLFLFLFLHYYTSYKIHCLIVYFSSINTYLYKTSAESLQLSLHRIM